MTLDVYRGRKTTMQQLQQQSQWQPVLMQYLYNPARQICTRDVGIINILATDIQKWEAVQRRTARWVYRDYSYTSSVTAMLKDLNWRPLDQRRIDTMYIDSRLIMLYNVTHDLVAIPASQNHIFPRSIIHCNALPAHIQVLPTLAEFSSAVCQVIHISP